MFYIHWQKYPFVRLLPAFLAGMWLGNVLPKIPLIGAFSLISLGMFLSYVVFKNTLLKSYLLHAILLVSGILLYQSSITPRPTAPRNNQIVIATINSDLVEKNKSFQTIVNINYKDSLNNNIQAKSIIYLEKSELVKTLQIGDQIIINANFKPINQPDLPGEFDYSQFMAGNGVYFSAYVGLKHWTNTNSIDTRLFIKRWASVKRNQLSTIIENFIKPNYQGLIKALILGEKSDIDKDVMTSFTQAGIMHVLAVSGQHVGILWSIIAFVLIPINRLFPSLRSYLILVEILCIWAFALITGFCPSVQRAAFMFTLLSLAKIKKMETNSINLVIASAIILLICNPKLILSIGFQLSYCAVIGIIILYPKIDKLICCKSKLGNYIWQIQAVSIAAVLSTTPLSIYYFHQFSTVFPISNLIAIPVAYILIAFTICLFLVSSFGIVASFIGSLISGMTFLFVKSIQLISQFSFSSLDELYIDTFEFLLLVLAISLITIGIYNFKWTKRIAFMLLIIINISFIYRGSRKIVSYSNQQEFKVINKKMETQYLIVGNKLFTISTDTTSTKPEYQLNGFKKEHLVYKNEMLVSSNIDIEDQMTNQRPHFADHR